MKLEDINKENIHKVPEGYFDELPQLIQSKIADQQKTADPVYKRNNALRYSFQLALPVAIILMVVGYFAFFKNTSQELSPEEMLAEVDTNELVLYLEESEITTEEIIENIDLENIEFDFNQTDSDLIDDMSEEELDGLLNDYEDFDDIL